MPIGALLVGDDVLSGFVPGDHASTFGGNCVACAAACAVVDAIDAELLEHVRVVGERLRDGLSALPAVRDVRGAGLLVGAELDRPASEVVSSALEHGLLITSCGETAIRLTPPLLVPDELVEQALGILREVV